VDRAAGVIHFRSSKTEDSSGLAVDVVITPEIDLALTRAKAIGMGKSMYVIHTQKGKPYAAHRVLKAWKVAKARAKRRRRSLYGGGYPSESTYRCEERWIGHRGAEGSSSAHE
jgi:hypothetical protein